MLRVRRLVEAAGAGACSVLLAGETGTGKGYWAERIHTGSTRAVGPFVHVFAGTLAPEALDATSPASAAVLGAARGGSLFLDDIEELTALAQARLARLLEAQTRGHTPDTRLIVATQRDPATLASSANFRRDLFFRLSALTIGLPPLRERGAGIMDLARRFVAEAAARRDRSPHALAPDTEEAVVSYAWPGNVRQLRSVLTAAMIAAHDSVIRRHHLWLPGLAAPEGETFEQAPASGQRIHPPTIPPPAHSRAALAVDRASVADALARNGGNQSAAARALGVSRRTLINRIEQFDLPRPRKRGGDET